MIVKIVPTLKLLPQACGTIDNYLIRQYGTLFDAWLCGFYVCTNERGQDANQAGPDVMHSTLCRNRTTFKCNNTDADMQYCDNDLAGFHRCGKGKKIRFIEERKMCDGRSDCFNGEDEIPYPGSGDRCRFGVSCETKKDKKNKSVSLTQETFGLPCKSHNSTS